MAKISFQERWLQDFPWLKRGPKIGYAFCSLCNKDIYFASMGKSCFTSHAKSTKHKLQEGNATKSVPIKTFLTSNSNCKTSSIESNPTAAPGPSTSSSPTPLAVDQCSSNQLTLSSGSSKSFLAVKEKWWEVKDHVTECEALWCLQAVMCHFSLRDAESCVNLFQRMFKSDDAASCMKLGKTKISYSIVYGLAPYFKNQLVSTVNKCDFIVLCFDESLNKVAQKQQLDIILRFWDESTSQVCSRYLDSVFLNRSTAVDLLSGLKEGLGDINVNKVIQVSMDGPNVNWKLFSLLQKELEAEGNHSLLNIGSCGLHVANVAFKTGIKKTTWSLISFFRASYYLFKDSPSRRGIFMEITNSSTFPLKFCSVRWTENVAVAKRALETADNLRKFVAHVKDIKLNSILSSASFQKVSAALDDKLLIPKIAFFMSLAEDMEPFLKEFQADSPMAPFLHSYLSKIVKQLMARVVKEDVVNKTPLQDIDISKKDNLKMTKNIDLGYATRSALRNCHGLKDIDILMFRRECNDCLKSVVGKLMEKSPLKYPLTQGLSFLNPNKILITPEEAVSQMVVTMDILVQSSLITASVAQSSDREYRDLILKESAIVEFKSYTTVTRLDNFWINTLNRFETPNLRKVVCLLLPLAHGNASVERGFSVNKDILVENLKQTSIVAQRLVYDAVAQEGGLEHLTINKGMLLAMRNSSMKYKEALEASQLKRTEEEKRKAEKRKASILTKELEDKKRKLLLESERAAAALDEQIKLLKKS